MGTISLASRSSACIIARSGSERYFHKRRAPKRVGSGNIHHKLGCPGMEPVLPCGMDRTKVGRIEVDEATVVGSRSIKISGPDKRSENFVQFGGSTACRKYF